MSLISIPRILLALVCLSVYGVMNILLREAVLLIVTGSFSVVAYRFNVSPYLTIGLVVALSVRVYFRGLLLLSCVFCRFWLEFT
jgi:hypothetical protein